MRVKVSHSHFSDYNNIQHSMTAVPDIIKTNVIMNEKGTRKLFSYKFKFR